MDVYDQILLCEDLCMDKIMDEICVWIRFVYGSHVEWMSIEWMILLCMIVYV